VTRFAGLLFVAACSSPLPSPPPVSSPPTVPVPAPTRPADDDTVVIRVAAPADAVLPAVGEERLDDDGFLVASAWPPSLAEAVDWNLRHMAAADLAEVKKTPRRDLIKFHHGWGTWIRNNFGLWRGNRRLIDACGGVHPDDCSMKVIEATWERLQRPTP